MRVLALVSEPPWPPESGYRIRCWEILRRLAERHEVRLVALTRGRPASPGPAPWASVDFVDGGRATPGTLARSFVGGAPHHALAHDNARLRHVLGERARDCDVAYVHYLYFARPYFSLGDAAPPAVLDQHNVDHVTWDTHAQAAPPGLASWLRRQARLVRDDERTFLPRFRAIVSVSEADAALTRALAGQAVVAVAPNAADTERLRPVSRPAGGATVLFTGTSARRNVEGLAWFLRESWPRIRQEVPRARLLVAGSLDPARLPRSLRHETGVTFTGRREDLQFAFDAADLSVVPVRIGGGTKLKVFESLSAGLPVVARPEAVDGECCDDLHGVLVRSDAMSYAAAVVSLLASPDARCELGRRARAHAVETHDWATVTRHVESVLESAARAQIAGPKGT